MKQSITFLHCADLHLDSPFKGMSSVSSHVFKAMKESTFQTLDKLVEQAIYHQVDFVLIVGDIFDHHKPSLKTVLRFKKAMERLKNNKIEVFISYGNHDFSQGRREMIKFPENVHTFTGEEVIRKPFLRDSIPLAYVYGFSYTRRAVTEKKVQEYEKDGNEGHHIAMLHGSISTNTEHDVYAPFQLSEVVDKPFDYWALGHIHKRQILSEDPPVVYPGNIQGRSRKESGEKGCFLVKMDDHETKVSFLPLQQVRFEFISIAVKETVSLSELESLVFDTLLSRQEMITPAVIDFTLESSRPEVKQWQRSGYLEDIAETINHQLSETDDWMWIRKLEVSEISDWNLDELRTSPHFVGELVRDMEQDEAGESPLSVLYNHKRARKYLEPLTKEEENELVSEARDELLHLLMKE